MALVHSFHCKTCRKPILLPSETLARTLEDLALDSTDSLLVALACNHCSHVYTYALASTEPRSHDAEDTDLPSNPGGDVGLVATLLCDAEGCDTPLPLFAQWSATTTPAEKQAAAAAWIWAEMTCQSGHPIAKPVAGLESILSLRCPNWKREGSEHCDATLDYPRDWFQIGKRVECPFCGLVFRLTPEHIEKLE